MKRSTLLLACAVLGAGTLLPGWSGSRTVRAAGVATPDYEVKWYLDPAAVLGSDHKLKSAVLGAFDMPSTVEKMNVAYLDGDDLDLNAEGWNVRIRKMESYSDEEFEVTYKMRYPIVGGNVQAALNAAAADGFDADEDDYEAQVDWGYSSQTLSFSNKKDAELDGYDGMELPDKGDAREVAEDLIPGKLEDWQPGDWAADILHDAHVYGPVGAKRSIGEWDGEALYIEVWEIKKASGSGYEYLVEASFKEDDYATASAKRASLKNKLISEGWFLPQDGLKTTKILERY
ncbi:hypothetical protein [Cohnella rhizosphaerae]|uniref:CYTH domain-containing protein n=1 Tax=Cohnella rhizosphaerae TaxID=1457232 RepID=A0A9X4QWJ1_9BACL|nr:hypothetical protein [Cohnella rhizosphaerae]MDG0812397.1 hypothetical protein [Cohnella rhizosphaerae]